MVITDNSSLSKIDYTGEDEHYWSSVMSGVDVQSDGK